MLFVRVVAPVPCPAVRIEDCGGTPLGAGQDDEAKDRKTKRAAPKRSRDDRDMGSALRSVYQRTVEEEVPDEFLDLLGKLD